MINNIIFDLDGTILDTSGGIIKSIKYVVEKFGFHSIEEKELKSFIGPPIQESFEKFFHCSSEKALEAAQAFRECYKSKYLFDASPYDGIFELMDKLISLKIKIAVATYKREEFALNLLKHFSFNKYCSVIHGSDNKDLLRKKDIILRCQNELGGKSFVVGDSAGDALAAQELGLPFIAVTYGFGFKSDDSVKTYKHIGIAQNPIEIIKFFICQGVIECL